MSARYATYRELDTWYTLEEAHMMYEALYVDRHNEWLANKLALEEAKRTQR